MARFGIPRSGFSNPNGVELGQQLREIVDPQLAGIVGRDQDERRREVARNIGNWGSLRQFPEVVNEVGNSYVINDGVPEAGLIWHARCIEVT